MDERNNKRDLVLAPGEYAYMQDVTKGVVKTYTGPTVINPTAQERPIIFDETTGRFVPCSLDEAVQPIATAPEGSYLVLENPSARGDHPGAGGVHPAPDLAVGRTLNLTGPRAFALWPGEVVKLVPGHHLRSNQYVLVRVLNEDEARRNWAQAVMKPAAPDAAEVDAARPATPGALQLGGPPAELNVGQLLVIRGTDVSFYIPPTGLSVVPDAGDRYVRDALTLERLEYCILVDEDGNKRYERGPQVVFPAPTEVFVEQGGQRKFRAIELSELHGLHIKVIAPYSESGREHREGDELFITGKQTAIYYPREEHSLIRVDGRERHVAVAIPAGEGRYVVDRTTGVIRIVHGPAMFLADPIREVLVRRVLSDRECATWYPGNTDVLAYNHVLRAATDTPAKALPETRRASLVLDTRFDGVPRINVWVGYAVMVVDPRGQRRVVTGPASILLEYDESLEVLQLSTGTPKRSDKRIATVYLRTLNNRVSDRCTLETADHVGISISYALRVGFEGDPQRWFEVEDYVQLLSDHVRSLLRAAIKRRSVDDVYANVVEVIRDAVLGVATEGSTRPGLAFKENGMRVTDVEILDVVIGDEDIAELLGEAQRQAVEEGITLVRARRGLELTRQREQITRATAEEEALTRRRRAELELDAAADRLKAALTELEGEVRRAVTQMDVARARNAAIEIDHSAELARRKASETLALEAARSQQELALQTLSAEVEATVRRFGAAQTGFSEALLALSSRETLAKVAEAMSVQTFVGGKTLVDVVHRVFEGTPLADVMGRIAAKSAGNGAWHAAPEADD
ncbi:MAG TPA: SPFH domain-containing protein [Kofleriaceae bacterium]|nr:SPFH domain-containing protein [Kofleriaceae bacterium]